MQQHLKNNMFNQICTINVFRCDSISRTQFSLVSFYCFWVVKLRFWGRVGAGVRLSEFIVLGGGGLDIDHNMQQQELDNYLEIYLTLFMFLTVARASPMAWNQSFEDLEINVYLFPFKHQIQQTLDTFFVGTPCIIHRLL